MRNGAERKRCTGYDLRDTSYPRTEERAVSPHGSFIIRGRVMSTANADEAVIRYIFQRALSCRFSAAPSASDFIYDGCLLALADTVMHVPSETVYII